MSNAIEKQLNESYRDALVAYYLSDVVPNHLPLLELGLQDRLKTANDLYEFFLLDNQVSNDVMTSPVASAISSLQQYINGCLMGMEPGYTSLSPNEAQFVEWRDRSSQYPIWAANQQLALYPEIYISPDLRLKKSTYFTKLENDINQNKISIDTTQEAVKSYLASFEEVADLTIINGYIDSDKFDQGTYYFIGKSRAENMHYWRKVDMNERAYIGEGSTEGPKQDNPTPGAWSDWEKADIGINANTIERTIRPVFFNNRLFATWVDLIYITEEVHLNLSTQLGDPPYPPPDMSDTSTELVKTPNVKLLFNIAYKKYDNSWSAPQIYLDITTPNAIGATIKLDHDLNTIAVFDISHAPDSLFIAMYAGEKLVTGDTDGTKSTFGFLQTAFIDKNFNITPAFPLSGTVPPTGEPGPEQPRVRKSCWTFALKNKNNFQFTWGTSICIKTATTTSPSAPAEYWNYGDSQARIGNISLIDSAPVLNLEKSTITLNTVINQDFINLVQDTRTVTIMITTFLVSYTLILTAKNGDNGSLALIAPSTLEMATATGPGLGAKDLSYKFTIFEHGQDIISGLENFITSADGGPVQTEDALITSLIGYRIKNTAFKFFNENKSLTYGGIAYHKQIGYAEAPFLGIATIHSDHPPVESQNYSQFFRYSKDMKSPLLNLQDLSGESDSANLIAPKAFETVIKFDKATLLPNLTNATFYSDSPKFYIAHGVSVRDKNTHAPAGNAMKLTEIELSLESSAGKNLIAPKMSTRLDPVFGIAEYIDFSTSSISKKDNPEQGLRAPIRMNTLFAPELVNKANIALEALLSWDTQQLAEPPLDDGGLSALMDFNGANGLYFWELFLHLPFMISHRLNLEQQFNDAEFWLGFIFDPSRKALYGAPDYWNVRPLIPEEVADPDHFLRSPIDPDGIAASHPIRYQKAVYFQYIKNLIDRGDMAYRQLTPDSLGEAKLWYVKVLDLLGPRPDTLIVSQWTPIKLGDLAASTSQSLRNFEAQMQDQEQKRQQSAAIDNGQDMIGFKQAPLRLSTFGRDPTLADADNPHFVPPMNSELVKHWDTLESRLYNLRHNLTLNGKPMSLALFAAPLDPRAMLAAYANGATGASVGGLLSQETPHYRFTVMLNRASAAVETLIQFSSTLLSIIERKDQAEFQEKQQEQIWEFAHFAIDLQLEAQRVEFEARKALEASKSVVEARARFYGKLFDENVSATEIAATALNLMGQLAKSAGFVSSMIASGLKVLPNHVGVEAGAEGGMSVGANAGAAAGGFRLEGIAEVVAVAAQASAEMHLGASATLDRVEQFRRRRQEWEFARDQAYLEADQITAQLAVHDAQARVTAIQLQQAEMAKTQVDQMYVFLTKERFTNKQLYTWLNGQFSTLYYQAYDATLSLCLSAQACWQYEIADYDTSFIQPGSWKDAYRGLTAGESLKLNLLKMDAAYLSRNERKLEIVKTVSVKQLPIPDEKEEEAATLNKGWDAVIERLEGEGIAEFEITQAMLDADYPAHYLRRIKRISVSLPVTVGPYQDIRATLTQSYNAVQMTSATDAPLKENMRASQQIAVSTGVDDDGLFVFNFDDERYLPFEGTGVISRWTLSFPNPDSQRDMINSITDIIVHIRYTAKSGGAGPTRSASVTRPSGDNLS
ncbi:neuraminidase-like domain-containing protein [Pseudomonas sp. CCI4.2]|uniref:Tc toxin subunit A-related protein n=1 Tax=Pseudomonas sp. CCI4.2 TaxID=3048620 RepID=UPI002AC9B4AE|nr:neuraminidase-like domain-containing protein [Pseudomonas sp. CCI4.2]MEB0091112.1 neuraminidase-like domain-containing protein [Pseudomonas sp. CCI4.2]WPX56009.1 neuraminidase-like domain-containing protein [Pseudomonas sp. CCI4.2]